MVEYYRSRAKKCEWAREIGRELFELTKRKFQEYDSLRGVIAGLVNKMHEAGHTGKEYYRKANELIEAKKSCETANKLYEKAKRCKEAKKSYDAAIKLQKQAEYSYKQAKKLYEKANGKSEGTAQELVKGNKEAYYPDVTPQCINMFGVTDIDDRKLIMCVILWYVRTSPFLPWQKYTINFRMVKGGRKRSISVGTIANRTFVNFSNMLKNKDCIDGGKYFDNLRRREGSAPNLQAMQTCFVQFKSAHAVHCIKPLLDTANTIWRKITERVENIVATS